MKKYGLIIGLFLLGIILVYFFSNNNDFIKTGNIYINEIVPSNHNTYKSNDNMYYDYIELYNDSDVDIDLSGYYITDNVFKKKYMIPNLIIKSKNYQLIFASNLNKCDLECHTNFKLNKNGETISLIDKTGNVISRVSYPKLYNDYSYSYVDGKYIITNPSPYKENNREEIKKEEKEFNLEITEYMTHNKMFYASNGKFYDWVEIHNKGDTVNLSGLSISDNMNNLNKYVFPSITMNKDEYLVIYLTDEVISDISANFKLGDNDSKIIISYNDKVIDEVDIVSLDENISLGKYMDKWYYFYKPTPGSINNTSKGEVNGNT